MFSFTKIARSENDMLFSVHSSRSLYEFWIVILDEPLHFSPINIDRIWSLSNSHYVFSDGVFKDPVKFLKDLAVYIRQKRNLAEYNYLLWINIFSFSNFKIVNHWIELSIYKNSKVVNECFINLGNVTLNIPKGSIVRVIEESILFSCPKNNSLAKKPMGLDIQIHGNNPQFYIVPGTEQKIAFPLSGNKPFVFTFFIEMQNEFPLLDVSINYYYGLPISLKTQAYPIFQTINLSEQAQYLLYVCFDPLNPIDSSRTYFQFPKTIGKPYEISSNFITDYGHNVLLTPNSSTAKLVFQKGFNKESFDSLNSFFYLTAEGGFYISLDQTDSTINPKMMCGIMGTESISFTPTGVNYLGDQIVFQSGQNAYSPFYPLQKVNEPSTMQPAIQLLSSLYTTSWISLISSFPTPLDYSMPKYYSQPELAPMFAIGSGINIYAPDFLGFFDPPSKQLPTSPFYFPMAPYLNITASGSFSENDITAFEKQIITQVRTSLISGIQLTNKKKNKTSSIISSVTQQGLLAQVDQDTGQFNSLLLASNLISEQSYTLQLLNITAKLQDALRSNNLFLVVTSKTNIGEPGGISGAPQFQNEMSIAEWPFILNIGNSNSYGDYNNVLVFKFTSGKLVDLIQNPSNWTQASDFNDDEPSVVSVWIQNYMQDAINQYEINKDTYYENFYNIINDENWFGILALKTDISLYNFPQQLQGLLAGIDLSQFNGHHFGINVNQVSSSVDGTLQMSSQSSMFGLLAYQDAVYLNQMQQGFSQNDPVPPQSGIIYDFKVLVLKVLLENSDIKGFTSKVQLTINELFGDKVQFATASGNPSYNSVVLDGTYQDHDGTSVYVFEENSDSLFTTGGNILSGIEIERVQFNTLQTQGDDTSKVYARFAAYGYLHFSELPNELDIYSFGGESDPNQAGVGLYFYNLFINLDFCVATPSVKNFGFDPAQMSFDPLQSYSRSNSIYKGFPLKVTSLICGENDKTPNSSGYLEVNTPQNPMQGVSGEWYGLECSINMGTAGALASDMNFSSSILLAWSPGSTGTNYSGFLGLELPGTGGFGKLMSIQGILKLSVENIELTYIQGTPSGYLLKMDNIALKFLGLVKLPDVGNTMCYLFSNQQNSNSGVGWYAAYVNENILPPS